MKRFLKLVVIGSALAGLAAVAVIGLPAGLRAAGNPHTFAVDVACDCRTGSPAFFSGSRGEAWIVSGKIFPAGTLPTGEAKNDPTLPVRGVNPIGDWTCRGQVSSPFPAGAPASYNSTPFAFNSQYFILNDGRALTVDGYEAFTSTGAIVGFLSITGGIGAFAGAAGDIQHPPGDVLGTNVTGCPNFRTVFRFQPGSVRGGSQ
jgi:hypothetical protein